MENIYEFEKLRVSVSDTREEMGVVGAKKAAELICRVLSEKDEVNIIFASAPSQMDVLNELLHRTDVDWKRINAFHMDEYIGLPGDAPQSFGQYLRERFFTKKPFKSVQYLNGNAPDLDAECKRYGALLEQFPVDISFVGIGANGHLAFNDPGIADFQDPVRVKVNGCLDDACINQQIVDGWFATPSEVPRSALTVTMPALVRAPHVIAIVPDITKADILKRFLEEEISTDVPATIIRKHEDAYLYLDADSASKISVGQMQAVH